MAIVAILLLFPGFVLMGNGWSVQHSRLFPIFVILIKFIDIERERRKTEKVGFTLFFCRVIEFKTKSEVLTRISIRSPDVRFQVPINCNNLHPHLHWKRFFYFCFVYAQIRNVTYTFGPRPEKKLIKMAKEKKIYPRATNRVNMKFVILDSFWIFSLGILYSHLLTEVRKVSCLSQLQLPEKI